jgi:hypothetical protein
MTINLEAAKIALDRVRGETFEQFVNAIGPEIFGENFIPLGGIHDGGADAFQDESSQGAFVGNSSGTFYQASREEDHREKVRKTVRRLRKFGRSPTRLILLTPNVILHIDREQLELSRELGVEVQLRDRNWIIGNLHGAPGVIAAYRTYLEPELAFLREVGGNRLLDTAPEGSASPAVYVFLVQELQRKRGKRSLTYALADGLILWALEGTDPQLGIFRSAEEVELRVFQTLPSTQAILHGVIPRRLHALSKISKAKGRPIRWHRKTNQYCLAYELRAQLEADNASDEALKLAVEEGLVKRVDKFRSQSFTAGDVTVCMRLLMKVIQQTFERQGLEFAAFIGGGGEVAAPIIADTIDEELVASGVSGPKREHYKEALVGALRGAFYQSTKEERLYFSRLSSTYTLLFCLNTEPRIVEYFQRMAADFTLLVGSDLIVRALSERYLRREDQMTRNLLRLAREAGARLLLAEPVLEEVYWHLRITDLEFQNLYQPVEGSVNPTIAQNADKILIRSYFYARHSPPSGAGGPASWQQFMNQFLTYADIERGAKARDQLRRYLVNQFGLLYVSRSDLLGVCDPSEVAELARALAPFKPKTSLAENDALMALAIYGRRKREGEQSEISEYGYRTWWLTGETTILQHTKILVAREGARYMMRPEFLLNFLALAPTAAEVRRSYEELFPSLLGIRLARRVSSEELTKVLERLKEAEQLEPGRRQAAIATLSDELKGDFLRAYTHKLPR